MSEIELVLDSMRKTGECVSELETALGQHHAAAYPAYVTRSTRKFPSKKQRVHRRWRHLSWFYTINQKQDAESSPSQVIGRLREKEAFLSEVTKQLRELETSVDELSREIHHRHN